MGVRKGEGPAKVADVCDEEGLIVVVIDKPCTQGPLIELVAEDRKTLGRRGISEGIILEERRP